MSYRYYNTLEIIGDKAQIEAVKKFIRGTQDNWGREIYFDFNKVVKMPEEIETEYEKLFGKHAKAFSEKELFLKENEELVNIQQECLIKLENWRYDNWHSKCPAIQQTMEDENIINYTTINGRGITVVEKLSKLFSGIIFVFFSLCDSPDDEIYHFINGEIMLFAETDYYSETILKNFNQNGSFSKLENREIEFLKKNGLKSIE